jgi:hypothetical protein
MPTMRCRYIVQQREHPVIAAFRDAPHDDEPFTAADGDALAEVHADRTADVPRISYAEFMRKHGSLAQSRGPSSSNGAPRRDLERLDPPAKHRVLAAIGRLADDPGSADLRRLKGRPESRPARRRLARDH